MDLSVDTTRIRRLLLATAAPIAAAGLAVELGRHYQSKRLIQLRPLLSLSFEQNIPTFYSCVLLLACALCLWVCAKGARAKGDRDVRYWWGLSLGFFYMSLDELVEIHEQLGRYVSLSGVFYFGWVVPAGIVVLALGLLYLRFVLRLPPRTRNRFVLAGIIYVGGALLMELPLGLAAEKEGIESLRYALIDWVEEVMEIGGASLFLLALLDYIEREEYRLEVTRGKAP